MKILVTGAGGFIGRHLLPRLTAAGHSVVAADILVPAAAPATPGTVWRRLDVLRVEEIYKLLSAERPDAIVHLVSWLAGPCEADPLRGWGVNFTATQHLLDAGMANGLKRFVFSSSVSVFGKGLAEPVQDEAVKEPATIYGQTKLACENLLRWYRDRRGLAAGAVRFPWVYGPGRENGITAAYSSKLVDAVARREPLVVDFPEEKGDWLYVKDAVKALLLLLDAGNPPRIAYNVMGGLYTVREAMAIAKRICPEADIAFAEAPAPSDNPYPLSYDDTPARRDLGWSPDYSLEEGFRDHIAIVRGEKGQA
ncbi:MAG: NAD(P)-dependent oxidoreductase [Planctomycetota bacterium]|jgi:UDP-glucose 4-epimerase|nr:NAD(P)-dependent oxidoreductase [Planctomycetota bacterium]